MNQGIDTFSLLGYVSFFLYLGAIIIPIWFLVKVNSIDKSLKKIAKEMEKRN